MEEYESDPDNAIVPMRRREASDDEEEVDRSDRRDQRAEIGSDQESDGQGGVDEYEEENEEIEEEEEYYEEEEEEELEEEIEEEVVEGSGKEGEEVPEGCGKEGEEKKENEPFAVPTAGAFYMHDDRFRENGRGRPRHMRGGRRIWESKDERAWVHDRFEQMSLNDAQGRQNSRGRFRGRGGKNRGTGRGYIKDSRPRNQFDDNNNQFRDVNNQYSDGKNQFRDGNYQYRDDNNQFHDGNNKFRDGNNQNRAEKSIRGRGPRRYVPRRRNEQSPSQYKQATKLQESASNVHTGRQSSQTPNVQPSSSSLATKNVFASSLNSASPPFYPSGKQDVPVTQRKDAQYANTNKVDNSFVASQSGSMLRGKAVIDSVNHNRSYIDDSLRSASGITQSRVQGRNININSQTSYQPNASIGQVARTPMQTKPQNQFQPAPRVSTQQVVQKQKLSPPNVPSANITETGETDSPPGSSNSTNQLVSKGKNSSLGDGRGSFLYSGAQIIGASGAMGLGHNDQNFSPALLPVMQFGGQHHGGLGVPAVGMAFPGYVAQPQLGPGNSEMTWVPVLAGAAGALGGSYPYIALDGNGYPRPLGQTSSSVTLSREASGLKPANALKPPSETVNVEFGQRQNKPRRYSKMSFGQ